MPKKSIQDLAIREFFSGFKKLQYRNKELIIRAEDVPQGIYYLNKGYIRKYLLTKDGQELTINIIHPGSFFPKSWAIIDIPNTYFFEAMTDVVVYRSPRQDFLKYARKDIGIMHAINKIVLTELNTMLLRMQFIVLGNATQRVAGALLMLGYRFGNETKKGSFANSFPVTQQQIATMAALTRESVGYELKKMRNEGLVEYQNRVCTITNPARLKKKSLIDGEISDLPYV